ncbi:YmfL family putative regulatory protein [Yersinia alsatica]|uniref:YmfL family putative regulatory protein n=1 Tax=Yersinia alsatica TaxID=2890317 RepID=UPI0011AAB09F|nr:YmfL family putative regulatory protein [Yersinia alsatica]
MKSHDPTWLVEKQPAWLVVAIKKTIASLPGGYAEAAEWLGVTQNAIFNRLRTDGDQIFPMGWAMVLQQASGKTYIADATSRATGGFHTPFVEVDTDNEEIGIKLAELVGRLGDLVNAYRQYIGDGVISRQEWHSLNDIAYDFRVTLMQFLNLVSMVYCEAEKGDATDSRSVASGALTKRVE